VGVLHSKLRPHHYVSFTHIPDARATDERKAAPKLVEK
jgi:hypothetical protein